MYLERYCKHNFNIFTYFYECNYETNIILGYYARKTLRRHVKRCVFNKDKNFSGKRHQAEGHTLMANFFGPDDILRTSGILQSLRADEVSLVAKRDKIICEVGRKYLKSHKQQHLRVVAKRHMRRLARLLIEARKIEKDNSLSLMSLLHPSKFKVLVKATKAMTRYDYAQNSFNAPSVAMQMGTLIKDAIKAAHTLEIQLDHESSKIKIFNTIKELIENEWAIEISTEAGQTLNMNRYNKPTITPMAEDLEVSIYADNKTFHFLI